MRSVLEKTDTQLNTAKAEGFRIFHEILPLIISGFAWLGASVTFTCLLLNHARDQQDRG
jgi:hypothetical protein